MRIGFYSICQGETFHEKDKLLSRNVVGTCLRCWLVTFHCGADGVVCQKYVQDHKPCWCLTLKILKLFCGSSMRCLMAKCILCLFLDHKGDREHGVQQLEQSNHEERGWVSIKNGLVMFDVWQDRLTSATVYFDSFGNITCDTVLMQQCL